MTDGHPTGERAQACERVGTETVRITQRDGVVVQDGYRAVRARASAAELGRVAPWLTADPDRLRGVVLRLPERAEIDAPVDEQLIVESHARSAA